MPNLYSDVRKMCILKRFCSPFTSTRAIICSLFLALTVCIVPTIGYGIDPELMELSIKELMYTEVTSPSKKKEPLFDAPAAVFVITSEDIRRSGLRSIPEILRMAPGVQVSRIDGSKWAISIRGFNGRFNDKLLVLMDGRVLYTPLFGGVYWEVQDTLLKDIDRIEVIRGPGAALWGPNAMNGVINIITKNSKDTTGGFVEAGTGSEERGFVGLRWGNQAREDLSYRVWGKFFKRDDLVDENGDGARDDWKVGRGGFRMDWDAGPSDSVTLLGDIYKGDFNERSVSPVLPPLFDGNFSGGQILGRWTHKFVTMGEIKLMSYYDLTRREDVFLDETRHTYYLDFQHQFQYLKRNDIIWGGNLRITKDDIKPDETALTTTDGRRTDQFLTGFFHDDITLWPEKLFLTLGSKFEYNSYSGFEVQPTARVLYKPHERHRLWVSVSRAVRVPNRVDETFSVGFGVRPDPETGEFVAIMAVPNEDFDTEKLIALEAGYRTQISWWLSLDITGFLNFYDDLLTFEPQEPFAGFLGGIPITILPLSRDNRSGGEAFGFEASAFAHPVEFWSLVFNYSYLNLDLDLDSSSNDPFDQVFDDSSPHHMFNLRSELDLPMNLEFDSALYFVSDIKDFDTSEYLRLDLRLGWHPTEDLELSLVGQNLFEKRHREFKQRSSFLASEVQRAVYGMVRWKF